MFNPKVTIIIPVYNGSNYLQEAIESAINQTYKNIEIIVVNDGSNDNGATEKIALFFGDKIKYIYKKNGGVATALNLGIEKASGEYISWLSHDDLYYPNKIEEQVRFLEGLDDKNMVIYSNMDIIDKYGNVKQKNALDIEKVNDSNFLYYLIISYIINGCTLLIPKKTFEIVGFFDINLKYVQDYDMWFRIYNKSKFIKLNKSLIQSRVHEMQDSRNQEKFILMMQEECLVYSKFIKNIGLKNIYDSYGGNLFGFIKDFIFKLYFKIKIILPVFIFIGKFNFGKKIISKLRKLISYNKV